jgi:DNA polymerase-3 subunit epsilon
MDPQLHELSVLVLDCQASGATPAYGDLIELGWAVCEPTGPLPAPTSRWIVPRTQRRVSGPVRELTGWSEDCLKEAISEQEVFLLLDAEIRALSMRLLRPEAPTVIHFARFELPFLRDLYVRHASTDSLPLDVVCMHQIAARLFPDLPRRNIRALAGYLGHSPDLLRRSAGHVTASAFIWRELVRRLATLGIADWSQLNQWLAQPAPATRAARRTYPMSQEKRRALPDKPGVYRFLRSNGDILYVGKATSLRKRVAGHFRSGGKPTERGLELLSQVQDIVFTETESVLEAALLETDEIKAIDPPYNLQLKLEERQAWFSDRARSEASHVPDQVHLIGPLPSRRCLSALSALAALLGGAPTTPGLAARVLAVPAPFLPEPALFAQGFAEFERDVLGPAPGAPLLRVLRASRTLWLARRYTETEAESEGEEEWSLSRVHRRLARNLVQAGLLERRARWLCLLSECELAFREKNMPRLRALTVVRGQIVLRREISELAELSLTSAHPLGARRLRQQGFDAGRYDRLRVLATELARVQSEGGEVALRWGRRVYQGARLAHLMRLV